MQRVNVPVELAFGDRLIEGSASIPAVLMRPADLLPVLQAVDEAVIGFAAELARAGALVSFNGKTFDAPVLETRYLYHRLSWAGADLPHLDVLDAFTALHLDVGQELRHRGVLGRQARRP